MFGHEYLESILESLNPNSDIATKVRKTIEEILSDELEIPSNSTLH
jgi:hypothetical protein